MIYRVLLCSVPPYTIPCMVLIYTDGTICPSSLDPVKIVNYYIDWVNTFWTYSSSEYAAHA